MWLKWDIVHPSLVSCCVSYNALAVWLVKGHLHIALHDRTPGEHATLIKVSSVHNCSNKTVRMTAQSNCLICASDCNRRKLERTATSDYTTAESSTLDDFQCQICLSTLRDCVALEPCGHNWCATCLSHHFASLLQVRPYTLVAQPDNG